MLELGRGREFTSSRSKIIQPVSVEDLRNANNDSVIVAAGGGFDLLHPDHVEFLERAKSQGDILVVLVSPDDSLRKKGSTRPIQNQLARARIVASLGCVDFVIPHSTGQGPKTLRDLNPNLYAKGRDYAWGKLGTAYQEVLTERGIPIVFVGEPKSSSTSLLIEKIVGTPFS